MAEIYSKYAFNQKLFSLYSLFRSANVREFYDDNEGTKPDLYILRTVQAGNAQSLLQINGTEIKIDDAKRITSGLVHVLYTGHWDGTVIGGDVTSLRIGEINADGAQLFNVIATQKSTDDVSLFHSWLVGNDSFMLSDYADYADGGPGNDRMFGGSGNDILFGSDGDDYLEGGDGDDLLNGGAGADTLIGGKVTVTPSGGNGTETLGGGSGTETPDGGASADTEIDTLVGGPGDDVYIVGAGDKIREDADAGTDTVLSSITYTLGLNLENLTLIGFSDINATGNGLSNIITGNAGANRLNGGSGKDTLIGGSGDDIYITDGDDTIAEVKDAGTDKVQSSASYTLGANLEHLTLTGTSAINGTGNALNNVITGNGANNILNGAKGSDTLVGGLGNDTYITDSGDTIIEKASAGTDTVRSAATYTLSANLENLTLIGASPANGSGNALNNIIVGNSADNTLSGGSGLDTLIGGLGNDTYIIDGDDTITERANSGDDTVFSSATYTLAANLENLTLTGSSAINGTGNTLDNHIVGNGSANTLIGDRGADTISGGAGNDRLIGGADNDSFAFITIRDSGTTTIASDVIVDFTPGYDVIDLSRIDAFSGSDTNDDFVWKGTEAFNSTIHGEVRFERFDADGTENDYTMIWIDNDSDSRVEMAIRLTGLYDLSMSDFIF